MPEVDSTGVLWKRWYDQDPHLSQAVHRLMTCAPDQLQTMLSQTVILLADKEFDAQSLLQSVKTIGVEKTMGLFKAKQRRRSYDKNPALHQAMNYLYVLSPEAQLSMANHVVQVFQFVEVYLHMCQSSGQSVRWDKLTGLLRTITHDGFDEARSFLNMLHSNIKEEQKAAFAAAAAAEAELKMRQRIKDNQDGMRIQQNL
jgi:hypothetical protein